ncbi:M56 family metallopeptidase [Mucilaginibacter ginkgonis]|uniref:TonB family protein n=1 Tax=Mucilaginibacter ginkgonis TaxID=2682091 RepID=A0A6I4HYJ2_9SPHI|nr:M56 family metallopeptidase [Mucilaginibacter ginkgonis]QQL49659.1 TonB family protein [Mucilaginibacter ginkgonis]
MTWWQYLLLVNVYLLLFYGFYALLLRSETFFRLNRLYLIGSAVLSFVIPVIQADWLRNLFITQRINQTIYMLNVVNITSGNTQVDSSFSLGQALAALYVAGVLVLITRLCVYFLKLRYAFNKLSTGAAFSFFNKVKLDKNLPEAGIISDHENVHARQWHSADVLLIEFVAIVNWFNPIVYLYRKAIKTIHEFIADSEIVNSGTEKQTYAMLLLSQTVGLPVNQLANSFFNHSLLKQRIMMLHKNPSQRTALFKYGLSAPLFALMVILSSATAKTNVIVNKVSQRATQVLNLKPQAVTQQVIAPLLSDEPLKLTEQKLVTDANETLSLAEPVADADTTQDNRVFTSVEQSAQPANGMEEFYRFLGSNIHYPAEARKNNIQGRVICQFIIEKDGSFSDMKVVRRLGGGTDEEAVRVLSIAPKWTPGKQNGKPVRQQYTIPIQFSLQDMPKPSTNNTHDAPPPPAPPTNRRPAEIVTIIRRDAPPPPASPSGVPMSIYVDTTGKRYNMSLTGPYSPVYFVDGVEVKSMKDIDPNHIESINIIKAKPGSDVTKDQIRITLKK